MIFKLRLPLRIKRYKFQSSTQTELLLLLKAQQQKLTNLLRTKGNSEDNYFSEVSMRLYRL